jgi:hypothetical protein
MENALVESHDDGFAKRFRFLKVCQCEFELPVIGVRGTALHVEFRILRSQLNGLAEGLQHVLCSGMGNCGGGSCTEQRDSQEELLHGWV